MSKRKKLWQCIKIVKIYTHDSASAKAFREENKSILDLIFSMTVEEREQWRKDEAHVPYTIMKESNKQKPNLN
jgi:hypothetical protein